MPYLVFPLEVSATTATVWVGAINENFNPAQVSLIVEQTPVALSAWEQWRSEDNERRVDFQRVTLENRLPDTSYKLACLVNGQVKSTAQTRTLPAQLPAPGQRPFTMMLGSCFYEPNDKGRLTSAFRQLPDGAKPHVKVFCGDQVYLDNPWYEFLFFPYSRSRLEKKFLKKYHKNWGDDAAGYREILQAGANLFCPDDHEYWNNAPFGASYVPDTWTEGGRKKWRAATEPLYRTFQSAASTQEFRVGSLSFFIADTRTMRQPDRSRFIETADFNRLQNWVDSLTGPGALVFGQVIFTGKASELGGRFGDYGLPDFKQYEELVSALMKARHHIVLLSGDVHFGRVARCALPSNVELIEIISSPMALVNKLAGGNWSPPPEFFPAFPVPNVVQQRIQTEEFKLSTNHFLTLEFTTLGAKVLMKPRYWPITDNRRASIDLREIHLF